MSTVRRIGIELVIGIVLVSFVTGCGKPKTRAQERWTQADGSISEIEDFNTGLAYEPGVEDALAARPAEGAALETIEGQFQNVLFDFDSAVIRPDQMPVLDAVADYLLQNPDEYVLIEGHCDERGSREYNLALGERRAQAARDYLIAAGIDPARIQTRSLGEEDPVDPGHNEAAWRLNRRAEFQLIR